MTALIRRASGQATVELVAAAPIVVLIGLLGLQALVAGANFVAAANVAHAGALAGQLGRDPLVAARRAAPGWPTGSVRVSRHGHRVTVRLTPRSILPGVASLLVARTHASFT